MCAALLACGGGGEVTQTAGPPSDTTAPTVTAMSPADGATGVALNSPVSVTFSEAMSLSTITATSVQLATIGSATPVTGSVSVSGNTATFTPAPAFTAGTQYRMTITTAVRDLAGNALAANTVATFTTVAAPPTDNVAPTVTSTIPADGATSVALLPTVEATFSEPMANATLTTSSVTLARTGTGALLAGAVAVNGNTVMVTPAAALTANTQYTATITTAATDLAGNALAANASWSFTTAATADVTPPTISAISPVNNAVNVAASTVVTATFSEAMNTATLTTSGFTLVPAGGGAAVNGTVSVVGNTATFTPAVALVAGTQYTATISNTVKDLAGNALAANSSWSFTTAVAPDVTAPTVTSATPANGATAVPHNTTISATFSESMASATLTTSSVTLVRTGGTAVSGTVGVSGNSVTFTPSTALVGSASYTATITTAATDIAGNPLAANSVWSFTTAAAADTTAPSIIGNTPANGATNVPGSTVATVSFSEPMNTATLTTASFYLSQTGGTVISGAVTVSGNTATFTPTTALAVGTRYTATVTAAVKDLAGNAMAANAEWSFTTTAAADVTPPTIYRPSPEPNATNIPRSFTPSVTFSEPMDFATLTTATIVLTRASTGAAVAGTVTSVTNGETTATFTSAAALDASTRYTMTVTAGAKDVAGNAFAGPFSWSFTTTSSTDLTPPTVAATAPANGANSVDLLPVITVVFSEPISNLATVPPPLTLTRSDGAGVGCRFMLTDTTLTCVPYPRLDPGFLYTARLSGALTDAAGNRMGADYVWSFTTTSVDDQTPPTVIAFTPTSGATNVPASVAPTVTFSEPMNTATITTVNFYVEDASGGVRGAISFSGNTATFTPSASLVANRQYRVNILAAQDRAGNVLQQRVSWTFVTVPAPDVNPPTVIFTSPANNATGVSVNAIVTATFSEPMNDATLTTSSVTLVRAGGTAVSGTVLVAGNTVTFQPAAALPASAQYTATITTAARDAAGNPLSASYSWSFTTAAPADATPPTVTSTSPANGATAVAIGSAVSATFTEPMANSTLNTSSVTLVRISGGVSVSGSVVVSGNTATFMPTSALLNSTQYTATITTAAQDAAGNALAANYVWSFTTAAPSNNGFAIIDAALPAETLIPGAVATRSVTTAGSYNVTWTATPIQAARRYIIALQP